VLHFLGRLPELGSLRAERAPSQTLPRLDTVVLNLLGQLAQNEQPGFQRFG
jgi:hypothetical protein